MKVTLMISVCTLLVLLQTTMAQFNNMRDPSFICSWPKCRPGTYFDKQECKCNGVTESTCAAGFTAVKSPHGLCSCQKKTRPHCPAGLPVLGNDCICTGTPTCPYGSILRPSTATCTAEPYCPYGADLFECKCVKEYVRQCPWGTLSWDGCECNTSYIPKCSDGCYLDYYGGCKCNNHYDHDHITCYHGTTCSEQGTYVSSINECCSGSVYGAPLTEELIAEGGGIQAYGEYSHRTGSGPCISCNSPH